MIELSEGIAQMFAWLPPSPRILSFDPASGRKDDGDQTGWAIVERGAVEDFGMGPPVYACREALRSLRGRDPDLLVIEEPAFIGAGNQWRLAEAFGIIEGYMSHADIAVGHWWTPKPSQWRAMVALNSGKRKEIRASTARLLQDRKDPRVLEELERRGGVHPFTFWSGCADIAAAVAMALAADKIARLLGKGSNNQGESP